MTISAWDIYWVMQLDSIGMMLGGLGLVAFLAGGIASVPLSIAVADGEEDARPFRKWAIVIAVCGIACFVVNSFLPSSKTAAAMVIVPAIANNETIRKEAGDLYALAKQGLAELVKPDAPEKSK